VVPVLDGTERLGVLACSSSVPLPVTRRSDWPTGSIVAIRSSTISATASVWESMTDSRPTPS
jgi:hypothetical protein